MPVTMLLILMLISSNPGISDDVMLVWGPDNGVRNNHILLVPESKDT